MSPVRLCVTLTVVERGGRFSSVAPRAATVLMIAFGVMNVAAMLGLAAVIAVEKVWRHGEAFARGFGVACLVFAVLLLFEPSLAPGLDPDAVTPMMGM